MKPLWESVSNEAVLEGVKAGLGLSLLPYYLVRDSLEKGQVKEFFIRGLALSRKFSVIYHKNKFLTKEARMLSRAGGRGGRRVVFILFTSIKFALYDILIPKVENYAVMQLDMENDMEVREQENAISVRDVTKVYRLYDKPIDRLKESMSISHKNYHRDFYALSGLSFQVKKGETVGIIGDKWFRKVYHLKINHRSA